MPLFEALDWVRDEVPHGAALNMAIDEVLLRTVEKPTLRTYRWARPALSFGYFVRFTEVEPLASGRELVRRWTGGGIVPHGDDFTFSLIVPRSHPSSQLSPPESYRLIHEAVAQAVGGAELAPATAEKVSESCFENPAASDVMIRGRKVAGGAQRRSAHGMLHQGSVQVLAWTLAFGEELAVDLARRPARAGITDETLTAATLLAQQRYGTEAWLKRCH
jgi:lipoate-protein ligase A